MEVLAPRFFTFNNSDTRGQTILLLVTGFPLSMLLVSSVSCCFFVDDEGKKAPKGLGRARKTMISLA